MVGWRRISIDVRGTAVGTVVIIPIGTHDDRRTGHGDAPAKPVTFGPVGNDELGGLRPCGTVPIKNVRRTAVVTLVVVPTGTHDDRRAGHGDATAKEVT